MRTLAISILLLFATPLVSDAFADPAPAPANSPVLQVQTVSDTGWDMVQHYGPIWGGMLLAFGVASSFVARNKTDHWLGEGRTLAGIVGGVGILGSVLEAHFGEASWSGVVVTAVGALKLIVSPTSKKSPSLPQFSAVDLLLVLAFTMPLVACARGPGPVPVIGQTVVDCTGANATQIDELFLELSPLVVGGHPDWPTVYERAKHAGTAIGGCVLAELVQTYLGGRRAPPTEDGQTASETLEQFRAKEAGGASFHTRFGDL